MNDEWWISVGFIQNYCPITMKAIKVIIIWYWIDHEIIYRIQRMKKNELNLIIKSKTIINIVPNWIHLSMKHYHVSIASSNVELKMKTFIKIIALKIVLKTLHLNAYSYCDPKKKTVAFHISNAKRNDTRCYIFIELSGIVERTKFIKCCRNGCLNARASMASTT